MRPNDNLVMMTIIFLAFLVKRIVGPSVPWSGYYFRTLQHKDLPLPVNPYASSTARSLTFCTALCARDETCKSVYATNTTTALTSPTSSKQAVTCGLISEYVDHSLFKPGNGTYAYIDSYSTKDPPPPLAGGVVLYNKVSPGLGLVAVYGFGARQIGVLYDQVNRKWPSIYGWCASLFNRFEAIEGTIISIEPVSSGSYKIHSVCKPNEVYVGEATCFGDTGWSMDVGVLVPCVSTTCYRINQNGNAIYNGTTNWVLYGQPCKFWEFGGYPGSFFPLDGFSNVKAKNYCRDPGRRRQLWCPYGATWTKCYVPKCGLDL